MWGQFGEVAAIAPIFAGKRGGFYVDVGAHDGVTDSNTLYFERHLGWTGICIEPHRKFYPRLVRNRPNSICLDVAVWDEELESVDFYATDPGGWSRVGEPKGPYRTIEVQHPKTRTLDSILEEHGAPRNFELLSVDVEGTEWHILNGFNLYGYLPRIVIIEDLGKAGQFDNYFLTWGYRPVKSYKRGIGGSNVIYCRINRDYIHVDENWGVKK